MILTASDCRLILPQANAAKVTAYVPHLNAAAEEFEINTPLRMCMFIAQLAHESGQFRWFEELWGPTPDQRNYELPNRKARELGNTEIGDGKRFRGRGPIQITGRSNYKKYGDMLKVDLLSDPSPAAAPQIGFRLAGAYWKLNNVNKPSDKGDIVAATKLINTALKGLAERTVFYKRARTILVH